MNNISEGAIMVLRMMGYEVVHPEDEWPHVTLNGKQISSTTCSKEAAWLFASQDLRRRAKEVNDGVKSGPDYQGEAQKLGFEVTTMAGSARLGWKNRDLDVRSLRHDYTEAEAWRAAFMWARRFAILWKD